LRSSQQRSHPAREISASTPPGTTSVSDRPTLTLYARVGKGEVALGRWPTTIGGWKTIEKSDGSMALKYKESVTGDAIWPEILATSTWHPATGIPTRKLLIKRGDTWEPKTEIIGPGYRATGWWRWCTIRSRATLLRHSGNQAPAFRDEGASGGGTCLTMSWAMSPSVRTA
jgi:hypothetical protein